MSREPGLSIIVVPEDGGSSRTFRLSRLRLRLVKAAGAAVGVLLLFMLGSWLFLALRASRVQELETRVAGLEQDLAQAAQLARALDELEARYERLRGMFGSGAATGLWLPPPTGAARSPSEAGDAENLPSAWPLSDRGFISQSLLEGEAGEHPGVDIAVPTDTYIRAAGAGTVAEVGEDPVYGVYVALDHGQGYSSLYAHASLAFVAQGQPVRKGEVIALSGNTGRSTAPHLHFEIMLEGATVDPLSMVRPPA